MYLGFSWGGNNEYDDDDDDMAKDELNNKNYGLFDMTWMG